MTPDVQVLDGAAELAQVAADLIADRAQRAKERFTLVLSGGSTPKAVFQLLASAPLRDRMPWQRIHVFWGDERNVAPEHADSNFRMAREALLDHVPLPPAQIHRILAEQPAPAAATAYEAELRAFFGTVALPRFDLVMLGLGDDGHTASLFPDTAALGETERWVVANHVPKFNSDRITLTYPVLNAAAEVMFLVAGAGKAEAVGHALYGAHEPHPVPAALIAPSDGVLHWLLDRAAMPTLNH